MAHVYNRLRDYADYRDRFLPKRLATTPLPPISDQRAFCGPRRDQYNEGSCTGHGGCATAAWQFRKYKREAPVFSPQNLYVNILIKEGTFPADAGGQSRTICQVLNSQGVCEEGCEPYVTGSIQRPNDAQVQNALKYKLGGYHRLAGVQDFLSVLGDPTPWTVLIGFPVYSSFESDQVANTGMMPIPNPAKEQLLGGHEVHGVGYNISKRIAIIENSWGDAWGDKGFFYMPFEVLDDPRTDLWVIHLGHWGKPEASVAPTIIPGTTPVAAVGHGG